MNKDELQLWRDEILRVSKVKKWLIVYDRIDSPTTKGLTQEQYEALKKLSFENEGKVKMFELKDGSVISTNYKMIIQNPEWRDPIETARKIVFYKYQRDFMERKNRGDQITWKEYAATKKKDAQAIKKQLLEVIENE